MEMASRESKGKCAVFAKALRASLERKPKDAVEEFSSHLAAEINKANTWDLWGAAYLLKGGCSDDAFLYFRSWLLTRGRQPFEDSLRDPETLVSLVLRGQVDDFECEEVLSIASTVYEGRFGESLALDIDQGEPTGRPWKETDLPTRLPRLSIAVQERSKKEP